jgi:hypothetical protein
MFSALATTSFDLAIGSSRFFSQKRLGKTVLAGSRKKPKVSFGL